MNYYFYYALGCFSNAYLDVIISHFQESSGLPSGSSDESVLTLVEPIHFHFSIVELQVKDKNHQDEYSLHFVPSLF